MTKFFSRHVKALGGARLEDFLLNNISLNALTQDPEPADLTQGKLWFLSTTGKIHAQINGEKKTLAFAEEQASIVGAYQGVFDASTGGTPIVLPPNTLASGSYWIVSVGGTIPGLGGAAGSVTVETQNLLVLNTEVTGTGAAIAPAELDLIAGGSGISGPAATEPEALVLASLPANTPTNVISTKFVGKRINQFSIRDADGNDLSDSFDSKYITGGIELTSLYAYSDLTIVLFG